MLPTKHLSAPIPRAGDIRADLPQGLELVIGKLLAKRREDRFDSAATLIDALSALEQVA